MSCVEKNKEKWSLPYTMGGNVNLAFLEENLKANFGRQHLSTFTLCPSFDVVILLQEYNLQKYSLVHGDEQRVVFIIFYKKHLKHSLR